MKKGLFTLAVLVMAFGNVSFAQHKANLKSNATQQVLKHYGVRDETTVVPEIATWETTYGEKYRTVYTYDEYDYYLIEEYTKIDEGDGWVDFSMIMYEYDFNGNVLEAVAMSVDDSGVMENDSRASFTYDGDQLSEAVYQEWEDGAWENETKEVYTYNGDITTVLYWDWNGNNWSSDELWTYTRTGNTIELVMQYMQGGAWQNESRYVFTLDYDENILEITIEAWVNNALWQFMENYVYHYEGGVYVSMTVHFGPYGDPDYRCDFSYENGNAVHGEYKHRMANGQYEPVDGEIEMAYGFNYDKKTFYGSVVEMTYFDVTQVDENVQTANFKVYPVPAENEISIEAEGFQKAEIYNLTGQKLMESVQNTMNVEGLSYGVYIIKVYDREGNSQTQRFVVK